MADRELVRVLDHRTVIGGGIEGLCEFSDGSREWRRPANVEVSVVNERTGEHAEVSDVKIEGVGPCE